MNDDAMEALIAKVARESADGAIAAFSQRLGIDEDLTSWYADRMWLRNRRELEAAVVKHGVMAVVSMGLIGIGAAIVFYIKTGIPK